MDGVVGKTIIITTRDAKFVGTFCMRGNSDDVVYLENVTVQTLADNAYSKLAFVEINKDDILDAQLEKSLKSHVPDSRNPPGRNNTNINNQHQINDHVVKSKDGEFNRRKDSKKYIIIRELDNDFTDVIATFQQLSVIAVAFRGVNLGRFGKLCWIAVESQTLDQIFLFDILSLGKQGFEDGLGMILSSCDILKVIHDCRQPSDLLYHTYNITLQNVFDTQVADVYLQETNGVWPKYVVTTGLSVLSHLCLDPSELNLEKGRNSTNCDDLWAQRPCSILNKLAADVRHLRQLRVVLVEKMLQSYIDCVDIYLNHSRQAPPSTAYALSKETNLLPRKLQELSDNALWNEKWKRKPPSKKEDTDIRLSTVVDNRHNHVFIDEILNRVTKSPKRSGSGKNKPKFKRANTPDADADYTDQLITLASDNNIPNGSPTDNRTHTMLLDTTTSADSLPVSETCDIDPKQLLSSAMAKLRLESKSRPMTTQIRPSGAERDKTTRSHTRAHTFHSQSGKRQTQSTGSHPKAKFSFHNRLHTSGNASSSVNSRHMHTRFNNTRGLNTSEELTAAEISFQKFGRSLLSDPM